jgi:hypothetical protein
MNWTLKATNLVEFKALTERALPDHNLRSPRTLAHTDKNAREQNPT